MAHFDGLEGQLVGLPVVVHGLAVLENHGRVVEVFAVQQRASRDQLLDPLPSSGILLGQV